MIKKIYLMMIVILFTFIIFNNYVFAWENPVTIATSKTLGYSYVAAKVEQETGHVYVVYKQRNSGAKTSNIFIKKFDGDQVSVLGSNGGNVSESNSHESYFPHLQIKNGVVHVAWTEHPNTNEHKHTIKYRNFDGNVWSKIVNLGSTLGGNEIEDVHMDVDDNGNVFIVYMDWGPVKCMLAYLIGGVDGVIGQEMFPLGGRQKHPDISISGDTLYVNFQWRPGGGRYSLGTAARKTTVAGTWINATALIGDHDVARPRLTTDDQGYQTYMYYDELGETRVPYFFRWNGSQYTSVKQLLSGRTYHFSDLATRGGSVFYAVQQGSAAGGKTIRYNWKKNNVWSGDNILPFTIKPRRIAVDLSGDGQEAVVVYLTTEGIDLIASGKIKGSGSFDADFSVNQDPVFHDSEVTFDASATTGLVDEPIVNYIWDFDDGTPEVSTTEPTITHTFLVYRTDVDVRLTAITESGLKGVHYKTLTIEAPYSGILNGFPVKTDVTTLIYNRIGYKVNWIANPENAFAGYQINKYQIWRALQTGTNPPTDVSEFSFVAEVDVSVLEYTDFSDNLDSNSMYYYVIRAVDSNGHISPILDN